MVHCPPIRKRIGWKTGEEWAKGSKIQSRDGSRKRETGFREPRDLGCQSSILFGLAGSMSFEQLRGGGPLSRKPPFFLIFTFIGIPRFCFNDFGVLTPSDLKTRRRHTHTHAHLLTSMISPPSPLPRPPLLPRTPFMLAHVPVINVGHGLDRLSGDVCKGDPSFSSTGWRRPSASFCLRSRACDQGRPSPAWNLPTEGSPKICSWSPGDLRCDAGGFGYPWRGGCHCW
ncbi:hypothetical protein LX36DRAFT_332736 [Colletotrichum falcatum]|nr:hypothetical protein LX36DRAFT_332736 [Colletotrichum falcatum]